MYIYKYVYMYIPKYNLLSLMCFCPTFNPESLQNSDNRKWVIEYFNDSILDQRAM